MKVELKKSDFKPICVDFEVIIQTPGELADIREYLNTYHPAVTPSTVNRLINSFCEGVIKEHDGK